MAEPTAVTPSDPAGIVAQFKTQLGEENVVADDAGLEPYASDYTEEEPRRPTLAARARSVEHVQTILRLATEHHLPVAIRVSGSNVGALAMPPAGGVVLDLSQMNRILEVNEEDMYALIEPGVTWEQLKAHLEESGSQLRLGYPLSPPDTSIMANVLMDGLSNLTLPYGAMGDWLGGLEAVLPTGEVIKSGAAAVTDIWWGGGPLPRLFGLFTNWLGSSGVVTKIAFQLQPTPNHRVRLFVLLYDREGAFKAMRRLARLRICDDIGGLSWPTGKMLFDVDKPAPRDPDEPEFFLYIDMSGASEKEFAARKELLADVLADVEGQGHPMEKPIDIETLVRLNPRFKKFAHFPTRLDFLIDTPGGGMSWTGTYGPMSRFEAYADAGVEIMERHGYAPTIVSRPMNGGHFGVLRYIVTFDKKDDAERARVRQMNIELSQAGLDLGFLTYKTPAWAVEILDRKIDPGYKELYTRVRRLLDPAQIMSPHCWRFTVESGE